MWAQFLSNGQNHLFKPSFPLNHEFCRLPLISPSINRRCYAQRCLKIDMDQAIKQVILLKMLYQENHSLKGLSDPTSSFKIVLLSPFIQCFEEYWASSRFIRFLLLLNNSQLTNAHWMQFYKLLKSIKYSQVLKTWWGSYSPHQQILGRFQCLFIPFKWQACVNSHSFYSQLFASFLSISSCLMQVSNVLIIQELLSRAKLLYFV